MDTIKKIFSSFLNIIASFFFIAVMVVVLGFVWDYVSATSAKFWMASPTKYNVHMVDIRDEGRMNTTTCWYIEKEKHQFHHSYRNSGKNCYAPDSVLDNWEDYGKNYRTLGFKFWAGNLVLFIFGTFILSWLPVRMIGYNAAGAVAALGCAVIIGAFVGFFGIQDIRAAYAPPKSWYVKQGGKIYSAEVKYYLQDKHGQVYYWSAGGTADATRVPNLGQPANNVTK